MKKIYAKLRTSAILPGAALCLVAASAEWTFAQRDRRPTTSAERRIEQLNRQSEEYERDKLNRDLKGGSEKPVAKRETRVVAQIEQDFEGLQAAYNQIVIAMASKKEFNYDSVLDAVAQINKCSTRLKGNLALPKSDEDKKKAIEVEAGSDKMQYSMLSLRKLIYTFVTNPLFESKDVLDIQQARRASQDLDRIIQLSQSIRKSGERLKTLPK